MTGPTRIALHPVRNYRPLPRRLAGIVVAGLLAMLAAVAIAAIPGTSAGPLQAAIPEAVRGPADAPIPPGSRQPDASVHGLASSAWDDTADLLPTGTGMNDGDDSPASGHIAGVGPACPLALAAIACAAGSSAQPPCRGQGPPAHA